MSTTTDIVARLSGMSADHGPDGWPAVRMREITALCEEVTRLRADFAALQHALVGDAGASAIETAHRLRAALAQAGAGREPVGVLERGEGGAFKVRPDMDNLRVIYSLPAGKHPLYAHPSPAQREPLSDVEIDAATAVARDALMDHVAEYGTIAEGQQRHIRDIARAIERAYGITTSGTKGAARTEDTAPAAGERANVALTGQPQAGPVQLHVGHHTRSERT